MTPRHCEGQKNEARQETVKEPRGDPRNSSHVQACYAVSILSTERPCHAMPRHNATKPVLEDAAYKFNRTAQRSRLTQTRTSNSHPPASRRARKAKRGESEDKDHDEDEEEDEDEY